MATKKTTEKAEKKITQSELLQLQTLNQDKARLITELGILSNERLVIDDREDALIEKRKTILQVETSLNRSLSEKYGNVTIDPNTGVISS